MAKFNRRMTRSLKLQILRAARSRIAKPKGWIKGDWKKSVDDGRYGFCLVGACNDAAKELGLAYEDGRPFSIHTEEVVRSLSIHNHVKKTKGVDGIPTFNDDSKTRKKDVLGVLDEYIEALEA